MKNVIFTQDLNKYAAQNFTLEKAYIAYVPIVVDKQHLFTKLSETLNFPDYFGRNWDALIDMYRDFCWIENENITIVHESLSELSLNDFRVYIETMLYCIDSWTNCPKPDARFDLSNYTKEELDFNFYRRHNVQFVFGKYEEKKIMSVIHDCMQTCLFEHNLKEEDL